MFAKVFQKMLDSSIWLESDSTLRVWLTLLLSMDSDGFAAFASVENLSRRARVKPSLTQRAIDTLEAPDLNSTTPDDEGRRIRRVDGGWIVLNCKKYRDISRHGDLRASRNKSAQPGTTQRNSAQLGTPTQLNTNEINKSVPEIEIEIETEKTTLAPIRDRPDSASDVAQFVKEGLGLSGRENQWTINDAVELSMKSFDLPAMGAAAQIVTAWKEYEQADVECRSGPAGFLKDGKFLSKSRWRMRNGESRKSNFSELGALLQADAEDALKLADKQP
jgi:hypothetical protein